MSTTRDPDWKPLTDEQKAKLDAEWEASAEAAAAERAAMSPAERAQLDATARRLGDRMQAEAGG